MIVIMIWNLKYNEFLLLAQTISFKSYDLGYLQGIINMMRPEHRGTIDILREMWYTEPQVPPTMLRKEMKELFLYTEWDYIHVKRTTENTQQEGCASKSKRKFGRFQ